MNSLRSKKNKRHYLKGDKKLIKLIKPNSESEDEGSERELTYYLNDRVKMMKEVLKIIKPKKIKSMAPNFMKKMDIEEINSMLLEELLGISNKRLKYIFSGQSLNEESSSTDPEDQPIDVISLDDISDDDLIIEVESDAESRHTTKRHRTKIKEEPKRKKIKKEKQDKTNDGDKNRRDGKHRRDESSRKNRGSDEANPMSEKNLMSVLELLELQARARAIKSQLALESAKQPEVEHDIEKIESEDDDEDAVIVESPKDEQIVITSSDSDPERNDLELGKNTVTSDKIRVIQQTTIKGQSHSFWKSSNKIATTDDPETRALWHNLNDNSSNKDNITNSDVNIQENSRGMHISVAEIPIPKSNELQDNNKKSEKSQVWIENSRISDTDNGIRSRDSETTLLEKNTDQNLVNNTQESSRDLQVNSHSMKSESKKVRKCKHRHHRRHTHDNNQSKYTVTKADVINIKDAERRKPQLPEIEIKEESNSELDCESIVLNVDQSEIDCINLD